MRAGGLSAGWQHPRQGAYPVNSAMPLKVLFLCTGNSARSILFAATLNHLGHGRFQAYSAGSQPAGRVNPHALAELARRGIPAGDARSKSWDEYMAPQAPAFDLVVTVCDSAASETCPLFLGGFTKVHWGMPDPAAIDDDAAAIEDAFRRTEDVILARMQALVALPVEALDRETMAQALQRIEAQAPATPLSRGAA